MQIFVYVLHLYIALQASKTQLVFSYTTPTAHSTIVSISNQVIIVASLRLVSPDTVTDGVTFFYLEK